MKKDGLKEDIIKLRLEGYSYNKIKNELNCAKSTVSYYCSKLEKKLNNEFVCDISDEVKNKIINMKNDHKTYNEILLEVDISRDKLKRICRNEKLNIPTNHNLILDEDIRQQMQDYYDECKSSYKVMEHFNLSKHIVLKNIITFKTVQNKDKRKKDIVGNVINWRRRTKLKLIEYKGGKCQNCEYDKSKNALCFHHIDPTKKDFNISGKSYSYDRLKNEVDKCVLVCSNCHIEIHDEIIENGYSEIVNQILSKNI